MANLNYTALSTLEALSTAVAINNKNYNTTGEQFGGNTTESPYIFPTGHNLSPEFSYFAAVCFISIIVISVCCNTVLIWIIVSVKKLHSTTHVFIVNLAISDLLTSVGTIPFDVEFMLRGSFLHGIVPCGIMHFTFLISLPSSVLNLTLLTAERLISVIFPFRRFRYLNQRKVIIAVIVTWTYTFFVALFPMVYKEGAVIVYSGYCFLLYPIAYDIFQLVVNFLIPILFICVANTILFYISNKHAAKIHNVRVKNVAYPPILKKNKPGSFVTSSQQQQQQQQQRSRRRSSIMIISLSKNIRAAKRLALLVSVFLFCWLTYIILVATNISCGICHPRELTWIGNIVNYSSSAVNPVLYGLLNTKIRQEILKRIRQFLNYFGFEVFKDKNENYHRNRNVRLSLLGDNTDI